MISMKFFKFVFVFITLLFSFFLFFSFVGEDTARTSEGLHVGNTAPQIELSELSDNLNLNDYKGKYVLVNFWAAYDAGSREKNVSLWNEIKKMDRKDVAMVSVSFDDYKSIYEETVKMDGIDQSTQFFEPAGENSQLFEIYQLDKGFKSFLLDKSGKILAQSVNTDKLKSLLKY